VKVGLVLVLTLRLMTDYGCSWQGFVGLLHGQKSPQIWIYESRARKISQRRTPRDCPHTGQKPFKNPIMLFWFRDLGSRMDDNQWSLHNSINISPGDLELLEPLLQELSRHSQLANFTRQLRDGRVFGPGKLLLTLTVVQFYLEETTDLHTLFYNIKNHGTVVEGIPDLHAAEAAMRSAVDLWGARGWLRLLGGETRFRKQAVWSSIRLSSSHFILQIRQIRQNN